MGNINRRRPGGRSGLTDQGKGPWGLSPSDSAFLWVDFPRCSYLKLACKELRPGSPFPSVFGRIDQAINTFYLGDRIQGIGPGMSFGVIGWGYRGVEFAALLPREAGAPAQSGARSTAAGCTWSEWRRAFLVSA